MMATLISWVSGGGSGVCVSSVPSVSSAVRGLPGASTARTASSKSSMPRPCSAEIGNTFRIPSDEIRRSAICCFSVSILLTARKAACRRGQQAGQFEIGAGDFGASIHHHDDGVRFLQRDLRLAEDFCRDEIFVFRKNAAGIHDAKIVPAPFHLAVEAVARDAGFVADNGAPRSDQIRLNSVDLPTLGRPTMATVGMPVAAAAMMSSIWMGHKIKVWSCLARRR